MQALYNGNNNGNNNINNSNGGSSSSGNKTKNSNKNDTAAPPATFQSAFNTSNLSTNTPPFPTFAILPNSSRTLTPSHPPTTPAPAPPSTLTQPMKIRKTWDQIHIEYARINFYDGGGVGRLGVEGGAVMPYLPFEERRSSSGGDEDDGTVVGKVGETTKMTTNLLHTVRLVSFTPPTGGAGGVGLYSQIKSTFTGTSLEKYSYRTLSERAKRRV